MVKGIEFKQGVLTNDGKTPIEIKWDLPPKDNKDVSGFRIYLLRATEEGNEIDVIGPQTATAKRKSFKVPVSRITWKRTNPSRAFASRCRKNGTPIQSARIDSEEFWIETGAVATPPPPEKGRRLRHLDELTFRSTYKTGKEFEIRHRGWDAARENVFSVRLNRQHPRRPGSQPAPEGIGTEDPGESEHVGCLPG